MCFKLLRAESYGISFLFNRKLFDKTNLYHSASSILIGKTMNCTSDLHEEKAEILNNFFTFVFTYNISSHKSRLDGQKGEQGPSHSK